MKIKTFLLTLVVIFMIFLTISCDKNREYNEAEVLNSAEILIKASETLNSIYYGSGIAYEKNESFAEGNYYPASILHLNEIGISTVDDLKAMTSKCFSSGLAESIIKTKLSSVSDEDGIKGYARYYQKYSVIDNAPECIMVYKDAPINLKDKVVYDYTSLSVEGSTGQYVYVTIQVTVTNMDGKSQEQQLKIALVEESDGWRIDSPTYASYIDDKYLNEFNK